LLPTAIAEPAFALCIAKQAKQIIDANLKIGVALGSW
jgi:hypothetical protein